MSRSEGESQKQNQEAKLVTIFSFEAEMQEETKDAHHFENLSGIEDDKS